MPATPIDVFLVADLGINRERGQPRGLIRSIQPAIGNYYVKVFPSAKSLQSRRKVQPLRDSKDIHILVRPNLPVTSDGDSLAACEEAKIFVGFKGVQVSLDAGILFT